MLEFGLKHKDAVEIVDLKHRQTYTSQVLVIKEYALFLSEPKYNDDYITLEKNIAYKLRFNLDWGYFEATSKFSHKMFYNNRMVVVFNRIGALMEVRERQSARVSIYQETFFRLNREIYLGTILNISEGGALMATETHLNVGDSIILDIGLPGEDTLALQSDVRTVIRKNLERFYGVAFIALSMRERYFLAAYVEHLLAEI